MTKVIRQNRAGKNPSTDHVISKELTRAVVYPKCGQQHDETLNSEKTSYQFTCPNYHKQIDSVLATVQAKHLHYVNGKRQLECR